MSHVVIIVSYKPWKSDVNFAWPWPLTMTTINPKSFMLKVIAHVCKPNRSPNVNEHVVLQCLRATLHTRLKACDHCILESLIGWASQDCPSALHNRRSMPKDPQKISWMKNLCGLLHGKSFRMFHGCHRLCQAPPSRGRHDASSDKPCQWYDLWMRIKSPHNYMVMAMGLCAKWPL